MTILSELLSYRALGLHKIQPFYGSIGLDIMDKTFPREIVWFSLEAQFKYKKTWEMLPDRNEVSCHKHMVQQHQGITFIIIQATLIDKWCEFILQSINDSVYTFLMSKL